jgi:di/tricarboxylate transporter
MTLDQGLLFALLLAAMVLFVWGRVRYDVVALSALIVAVVLGLVPSDEAFSGFGHPAVVLVAIVLAITRAFIHSGLIDRIAAYLGQAAKTQAWQMTALAGLAAVLSMFMNNIGALALIMPVALQAARQGGYAPAMILMPVAFGSILGGMVTLIGTPPNIIVSSFRSTALGEPFSFFAYAPVGAAVLGLGFIYIVLVGWRLLPRGRKGDEEGALFQIADYVTEVRVLEDSEVIGKTVGGLETDLPGRPHCLGLLRGESGPLAAGRSERIREGDILLLQLDPNDLPELMRQAGLELVADAELQPTQLSTDELTIVEAVIAPGSRLVGRTPGQLRLRRTTGVDIIAVAREGQPIRRRLRDVRLRAGDVLLLQTDRETLVETLQHIDVLPLAERDLKVRSRLSFLPIVLFIAAVGVAAVGLVAVPVALAAALIAMIAFRLLPLRELYEAIDWPVIVLLGAMIPIGQALTTTGATELIAGTIVDQAGDLPIWALLAILMALTMTLSDVMNNNATAVVMAPIGIGIAQSLNASVDAFLMAVAVGASCAFLTPIGHQNNTLIMGPGGYRFGDYWRMGLPLEVLVVALGVPMIMLVWGA